MLKTKSSAQTKGFTLIELLIVVLLIGVLASLAVTVINSGGIREKGRDAQRKSDLGQIQTALELYFSDYRHYPQANSWLRLTGADSMSTTISPSYINKVPIDPVQTGNNSGPCNNQTNYRYNYRSDANGTYYYLTAMMESETSNDDSMCSGLNGWVSKSGCTSPLPTDAFCYGVQNP